MITEATIRNSQGHTLRAEYVNEVLLITIINDEGCHIFSTACEGDAEIIKKVLEEK